MGKLLPLLLRKCQQDCILAHNVSPHLDLPMKNVAVSLFPQWCASPSLRICVTLTISLIDTSSNDWQNVDTLYGTFGQATYTGSLSNWNTEVRSFSFSLRQKRCNRDVI